MSSSFIDMLKAKDCMGFEKVVHASAQAHLRARACVCVCVTSCLGEIVCCSVEIVTRQKKGTWDAASW